LTVINGKGFLGKGVPLPRSFSLLNIDNMHLGYEDEYIALGLTPFFKKIPIPPKNNSNNTNDTNPSNKTLSFIDRWMHNFFDVFEK